MGTHAVVINVLVAYNGQMLDINAQTTKHESNSVRFISLVEQLTYTKVECN